MELLFTCIPFTRGSRHQMYYGWNVGYLKYLAEKQNEQFFDPFSHNSIWCHRCGKMGEIHEHAFAVFSIWYCVENDKLKVDALNHNQLQKVYLYFCSQCDKKHPLFPHTDEGGITKKVSPKQVAFVVHEAKRLPHIRAQEITGDPEELDTLPGTLRASEIYEQGESREFNEYHNLLRTAGFIKPQN